MTKHIAVPVTEDQEAHLRAIAKHEDVSIESVVSEMIQARVDYEKRFRAAVAEGLAAIERGETLSHDEVVAKARLRAQRLLGQA